MSITSFSGFFFFLQLIQSYKYFSFFKPRELLSVKKPQLGSEVSIIALLDIQACMMQKPQTTEEEFSFLEGGKKSLRHVFNDDVSLISAANVNSIFRFILIPESFGIYPPPKKRNLTSLEHYHGIFNSHP